jgi:hypothetical protein
VLNAVTDELKAEREAFGVATSALEEHKQVRAHWSRH